MRKIFRFCQPIPGGTKPDLCDDTQRGSRKKFALSMLVLSIMSLVGCGSTPLPTPTLATLASATATLIHEPAAFAAAASTVAGIGSDTATNTPK